MKYDMPPINIGYDDQGNIVRMFPGYGKTLQIRYESKYHRVGRPVKTMRTVGLQVPPHVTDVMEWLEETAGKSGYASLKDALSNIELPAQTLMVFSTEDSEVYPLPGTMEFFQAAAILARTGEAIFQPDSPEVWTRKRIHRTLRFVQFDMRSFYGLD